jgi:hypothetical protein
MYKILGVDQKEYGPASADEIRSWISQGRANAQTLAIAEGGTEWRPLPAFPEFALALAAAGAPAPFPTLAAGSGASTRTNGLAIAGFVLGLFSVICCFIGPLFGILGLIFSIIALVQINREPFHGGKGLAIAGIILSVLGFLVFGFITVMGMIGSVVQDMSN